MNRALLLASAACAFAWSAHAAEVRVFGTGAVQHSVQAIAAEERRRAVRKS